METILLIAVTGALNIACFFLGVKTAQMVLSQKEIKVSNPIRAIEEHREKKRYEEEQERLEKMYENIDNYDGTGNNQHDI